MALCLNITGDAWPEDGMRSREYLRGLGSEGLTMIRRVISTDRMFVHLSNYLLQSHSRGGSAWWCHSGLACAETIS